MSLSSLEMIVLGALLLVLMLVVDVLVCRLRHEGDSRRHERGSRPHDKASAARRSSAKGGSPVTSRRWLRRRNTSATVQPSDRR